MDPTRRRLDCDSQNCERVNLCSFKPAILRSLVAALGISHAFCLLCLLHKEMRQVHHVLCPTLGSVNSQNS